MELLASLEALQDMGVRDEDGYWHEPLAFAERPRYGNEREDAHFERLARERQKREAALARLARDLSVKSHSTIE